MQKTLLAIIAAAVVTVGLTVNFAGAAGTPADKVAASGSTAEVMAPGEAVTLLSEKIRSSNTADLILGVTSECVITTELTTEGNDLANARGTVDIWVEIDGDPVPVSSDDEEEAGKVTFCDHFQERETTNVDDEDATIRTLDEIGTSNAFNWLALNVGNGIHTLEVKADLQNTETTGDATAMAAVGKRTLIVEPTHAANREEVTPLATP
jgi:hypothetical protein